MTIPIHAQLLQKTKKRGKSPLITSYSDLKSLCFFCHRYGIAFSEVHIRLPVAVYWPLVKRWEVI